jgi:AraC-like DNA-binding protein
VEAGLADGELVALSLSSRSFDEPDKFGAFHERYGRDILKLEIAPLQDEPFGIDIRIRALPGLAFSISQTSAIRCQHKPSMIDHDDPVLVFMQSGTAQYQQNGQETTIHAGDALLTSGGTAGTAHHTASRIINCRISRSLIAPLVSNFDEAVGKPIDKSNPAFSLFWGYAKVLNEQQALSDPTVRRAVVTNFIDLAAVILGAKQDAGYLARSRGMAAARLQSIKEHILSELSSPALSLTAIAAKSGISVVYVRKLFESEGTTFTEFVLSHRLLKAHRMLTDPRLATLPITTIAQDAGFNDLSYFYRAFRRTYAGSPAQVRGSYQHEQSREY